MPSFDFRETALVLLAVCIAVLGHGLLKLYGARLSFYPKGSMRCHSLLTKVHQPTPKWNPIFGHLLLLNDTFKLKKLPVDIQRPDIFRILQDDCQDSDSLYYVDLWPFISPLLLVASPSYAMQTCQEHDLGKPDDVVPFLHPITGGNSIFTVNGDELRHSRSIFSSGINSGYMLNQTAHVLHEAEEYVSILRGHAQSAEIIKFDEVTPNYMMDVSGAMTLNTRLFCQRGKNPQATSLRNTLGWHFLGVSGKMCSETEGRFTRVPALGEMNCYQ